MKIIRTGIICLILLISLSSCEINVSTENNGLNSINASDLKHHLEFLASDEFLGRDTPSPELKIAAKYLAQMSKSYGLNPIKANNSFYQNIPLETSVVVENKTWIQVSFNEKKRNYQFPVDFGIDEKLLSSGMINGEMVFLGLGFRDLNKGWDDYKTIDFVGKVVVLLDVNLPESHRLKDDGMGALMRSRADSLVSNGAKAVLKVIDTDREKALKESGLNFKNTVKSKVKQLDPRSKLNKEVSFSNIQIRHKMAAAILGVSEQKLNEMFDQIKAGEQVQGAVLKGKGIGINVEVETGSESTRNVLALIEGSDPDLKDEYIIIGAHYDHIGLTEGGIYNGANDNGSGTVGLLELAQAMVQVKPKRSVLFAWFTGEEKGLWGSKYFVENPPVPLEKISACINLDVISGGDGEKITITGIDRISSEFDKLLNVVNEEHIGVKLDYMLDRPGAYKFFFTRSDHFPFIQNGIPAVWLGSHSDHQDHIHQVSDNVKNIAYDKMERITKLTYLLGLEVANAENMMQLDKTPGITSRGAHNKSFNWINEIN